MQGNRMVKSGYSYVFPLYWVERDGAPWKGPVRKHVSQVCLCLSVGSSSSTFACFSVSSRNSAALAAQRATQVPGSNQSFC